MRRLRAGVAPDGAVQSVEQRGRHPFHRLGRHPSIEPAAIQRPSLRHDAFRPDHRARAEHRTVHHSRMLADDAVVAHSAGMHEAVPPHRYMRAYDGGVHLVGDVHSARFAEPAIGADAHVLAVGTQERKLAQPAAGAKLRAPDYGGRKLTPDVRSYLGRMREVGQYDHLLENGGLAVSTPQGLEPLDYLPHRSAGSYEINGHRHDVFSLVARHLHKPVKQPVHLAL